MYLGFRVSGSNLLTGGYIGDYMTFFFRAKGLNSSNGVRGVYSGAY